MAAADAGEAALRAAVNAARRRWPGRLVAAYALGSLAHGGFAPRVSDVDIGLVFADDALPDGDLGPLLRADLPASLDPDLAGRLSVFSTTWALLSDAAGPGGSGRLPAVDRLDLLRHGRLLLGDDRRDGLPEPTPDQLVADSARFLVGRYADPERAALLACPDELVDAGARVATKAILFPVRFVYTAETGRADGNGPAVDHLTRSTTGPVAELAAQALEWRTRGLPVDGSAQEALRRGVPGLLARLTDAYRPRLDPAEAAALAAWARAATPR